MPTTFPANLLDPLKDASAGFLRLWLSAQIEELETRCESPIELLFGAILRLSFDLFPEDVELSCQYSWENYRIDFCVHIPEFKPPFVFIECDGHDFHERTKEQAANDRMKDRRIQEAGIPILRFTGSEIFRDAASCVLDVRKFIFARRLQQQESES